MTAALVRLRKIRPGLCRFAAGDAKNVAFLELPDDAGRRRGRALDFRFTLGALAPRDIDHPGSRAAELEKLASIRRGNRMLQQKLPCLFVEGSLNFLEQTAQRGFDLGQRHALPLALFPFASISPREHRGACLHVAWTNFYSDRNPAQIPFAILPTGLFVAIVHSHPEARGGQFPCQLAADFDRPVVARTNDRHKNRLGRQPALEECEGPGRRRAP